MKATLPLRPGCGQGFAGHLHPKCALNAGAAARALQCPWRQIKAAPRSSYAGQVAEIRIFAIAIRLREERRTRGDSAPIWERHWTQRVGPRKIFRAPVDRISRSRITADAGAPVSAKRGRRALKPRRAPAIFRSAIAGPGAIARPLSCFRGSLGGLEADRLAVAGRPDVGLHAARAAGAGGSQNIR